jgi:flavin-dependent dehydrogenase
MYDVIIVGARVAGSATATLLARHGMRVLVLDRAQFPSDTLSTHQIQVPGVARLARLGVLDSLLATTPVNRRVRFDPGGVAFEARIPGQDGVDFTICPRRTLLDATLVDAARAAGAEAREGVVVSEIITEDGRVVGVRGREKAGPEFLERARLIIGADGRHSVVARAVGAKEYRRRRPATMAYYAYWADVPREPEPVGELFARPGRAVGVWPTNDGMLLTYVAWPSVEFDVFRRDPEANLMSTLDGVGLGERFRAGRRAERMRGTPDLPSYFRQPWGKGWALVGDAGLLLDPITGMGISDALRDGELLAQAVVSGMDGGGGRAYERALAGYHRARDHAARPMYDFTAMLADLAPPRPGEQALFRALAEKPEQAERFVGVLTGSVPLREYMSPGNIVSLVGLAGFVRLALRR